MKLVHLAVATLIAAFCTVMPQGTVGQETVTSNESEKCDKFGGCSLTCENCYGTDCASLDCSNRDCPHRGYMTGRYGYGQSPICQKAKPGEMCPVHGHGPCPKEQLNLGLGLRQAFGRPDGSQSQPYFGMQPLLQPRPLFQSRQMAPNGVPGGMHPVAPAANGGTYPVAPAAHGGMYPVAPAAHGGMYPVTPAAHGGMYPVTPAAHGGMYPMAPVAHGGMYPPRHQPRFPVLHSFVARPPIYMTTEPEPPMPTYTTRGPRDFLNPNPPSIGY